MTTLWVCSWLFDLLPFEGANNQTLEPWKWCLNNRRDEQTEVYWHTYYCLQCSVQNSLKSCVQVTRQTWRPPPPFKTFILSNCLTLYFTLKSSRADSSSLVETLTICCMTFIAQDRSSHFMTGSAENRAGRFCWTCTSKATKEGKTVIVDRSQRFLLFPLPDRVYINYTASEAYTMKKGKADSFMLMRSSSGWGEREEGPGVFEADKNGNVPLAAQHPCIKASCWSLGSLEGEER